MIRIFEERDAVRYLNRSDRRERQRLLHLSQSRNLFSHCQALPDRRNILRVLITQKAAGVGWFQLRYYGRPPVSGVLDSANGKGSGACQHDVRYRTSGRGSPDCCSHSQVSGSCNKSLVSSRDHHLWVVYQAG